jgi:hypothetical protein
MCYLEYNRITTLFSHPIVGPTRKNSLEIIGCEGEQPRVTTL